MNGLDEEIFGCSLQIKKLLLFPSPTSGSLSTSSDGKEVKLPKIDVPTFDGNLLNWQTFWEQFQIAVHDRSSISGAEKLVYLCHALKDGSARSVIEGLSRSGEHYVEAVECLQSRNDRPRLIHQAHVRKITKITPLKEGSGKELRHLHDIAQQHLRALKAMHHKPTGSFITSLLELKLDQNTIFEWRKFSQKSTDVPHYNELLEFINLRAQASKSMEVKKLPRTEHHSFRKFYPSKAITSHAASAMNSESICVVCKTERHPLYACTRFKSLPRDKMMSTIKANDLCVNCLRPGHFVKGCQSLNRCRKCQKPHHTFIHIDTKDIPLQPDKSSLELAKETKVTSNTATGVVSNTLLMTCKSWLKHLMALQSKLALSSTQHHLPHLCQSV